MASVTGTLKVGLKIGETFHKEFEISEPIAKHIFDAEAEATADTPISFKTAVLCRQLVRIGDFTGPFTLKLLSNLKAADLNILLEKQKEADKLGEAEPPGSQTG